MKEEDGRGFHIFRADCEKPVAFFFLLAQTLPGCFRKRSAVVHPKAEEEKEEAEEEGVGVKNGDNKRLDVNAKVSIFLKG